MDVDSIPQQHGQAANTTIKRHEKVDRWKNYEYSYIFKLPYPGCGFFEKCKSMDYSNDKLIDRWYQDFQNFELVLLHRVIIRFLAIDWSKYKEWDFVHLTKNYLRFLLKLVLNSSTGVLFHCINGWDRTPLFISLLRLSIHDLPNRVDKSEEILFFCLHMLKHIHTEEFSIVGLTEIPIDTSGSTSGGGEEMRLNVSPNTSGSSSPPSDYSHEAPPQYFKPPSRSERGFPMPWSPYQTIPRNPILLTQNKSGEGTSTAASSLAATQAAAFGHPTGGHTAASSGGASFQDISTGSGDESLSSADESLSNPEILQRRGERLSEVHRLVSSAYRSILESRRNTAINRASYWAGSLFSEEASGSLSQ
ncbi:hypothetical protein V5799_033344 [Amblyomma americanum]|uniref:Myotubularin-related protein 14 n=1 Tax=Amblyomma americanum TaxID=6943 RepID=A0AAQ4DNK8_AMBAM